MTLADERLRQLDNPCLPAEERTRLRCRLAAEFMHSGQYEAARQALGEFWRGFGERPDVSGVDEGTAAEVLLQVGALSGWLGTGGQEAAKDLISESAGLFGRLGEFSRAAAARVELALCYWREGSYDEARVLLEEVSEQISDDAELKSKTVLRQVIVETSAGHYSDALRLLGVSKSKLAMISSADDSMPSLLVIRAPD